MKSIIKYQASDGREFNVKANCLMHEAILRNIETVMQRLPKRPDTCEFENGHGFIQHDPAQVELVKNAIIDMWQGDDEVKLGARAHPARFSILARFFDDTDSPLSKPWWRLCCIDDKSREWGQQYFAANPDKGEQIQLNP